MKKRYFMLLAAITIAGYAMAALFTDVYVYEYMKGNVYTLNEPIIRAGSTIDAKPFNADYVTIGGYSYSGTNKAYQPLVPTNQWKMGICLLQQNGF